MTKEMCWTEVTKVDTRVRAFLSPFEDEALFVITPGSIEMRESQLFITLNEDAYSLGKDAQSVTATVLSREEIKEKYGIDL